MGSRLLTHSLTHSRTHARTHAHAYSLTHSCLLTYAGYTSTEWASETDETVRTLCELRKLFNKSRQLLKKMGDLAGVGIEPDEQTELINATELLPGTTLLLLLISWCGYLI